VGHYQQVLDVEPDNADLHVKVAPLLMQSGDERGAWESYTFAARAYLRVGYDQKALAVFRLAARHFPRSVTIWEDIATIHETRGRRRDAVNALFEGAAQFRSDTVIETGIRLMLRAFNLEPYQPDVTLRFAEMLVQSGRVPQARSMLSDLRKRADRPLLLRISWTELKLFPAWNTLTAWLRQAFAETRTA
jgi:hypothetical protein